MCTVYRLTWPRMIAEVQKKALPTIDPSINIHRTITLGTKVKFKILTLVFHLLSHQILNLFWRPLGDTHQDLCARIHRNDIPSHASVYTSNIQRAVPELLAGRQLHVI